MTERARGGGVRFVIAEDDDDDYMLTEQALRAAGVGDGLERARDGEELLDLLRARTRAERRRLVVLLDLNMPRMDGRDSLRAMREDPDLRGIPVVVLTTSGNPQDIRSTYDMGGSSYIRKPARWQDLVELARLLKTYWVDTVELPSEGVPA